MGRVIAGIVIRPTGGVVAIVAVVVIMVVVVTTLSLLLIITYHLFTEHHEIHPNPVLAAYGLLAAQLNERPSPGRSRPPCPL